MAHSRAELGISIWKDVSDTGIGVALAIVGHILCAAYTRPGHAFALTCPVRAHLSVDDAVGWHADVLIDELVPLVAGARVVCANPVVTADVSVGGDAPIGHTLTLKVARTRRAVDNLVLADVALKALVTTACSVWLADPAIAAGHDPVLRLGRTRERNTLVVVEDSARVADAGNDPDGVEEADSEAPALYSVALVVLAEATLVDAVVFEKDRIGCALLAEGPSVEGITDASRRAILSNTHSSSTAYLSVVHALVGSTRRGDACVALVASAGKAIRAPLADTVIAADKPHAIRTLRRRAPGVRQSVAVVTIAIVHHADPVARADCSVEDARLRVALPVDLDFALGARGEEPR